MDSSNDFPKEMNILRVLCAHFPVGINKHFNMIACTAKLNALTGTETDSDDIWQYMNKKYNLTRLDNLHTLPFPNNEVDFDLSENDDFQELIEKRRLEMENILLKDSSIKSDSLPEISDDNTLSGASTPVHVTSKTPANKERKRKPVQSSEASVTPSTNEKQHPQRRRDRFDSEKTEKSETSKSTPRSRKDKEKQEEPHKPEKAVDKTNLTPTPNTTKETNTNSSSNRIRTAAKRSRLFVASRFNIETSTPKSSSAKKSRTRREVE